MKTTKSNLLSAFKMLCDMHNLPASDSEAIALGMDYYAALDYDRFNGGYLPVMRGIKNGAIGSFLSLSTNDLRLSVSKMYDKLSLMINLTGYIQNTGFGKNIKTDKRLNRTDIITVFARRAFISGSTYHSVRVFVNGDWIADDAFSYGYDDAYTQTASEILVKAGYAMQKGHDGLRFFGCKVLTTVTDVQNKKALAF